MFKQLEGDQALIVKGGVYTPVDLYSGPDGGMYVKIGSGYVRLRENGSTSKDGLNIERLHYDGPIFRDRWGRLCTEDGDHRKPMKLADPTSDKPFLLTKD